VVQVRRVLVGAAVAVAAVVGVPSAASGSCAIEPTVGGGIAIADVVFVGTVVDTDNHGRYATFAVDEIWKGAVDARVAVRGGPPDPDPGGENGRFVASSVERRYEVGMRYLVTASNGDMHTGDEGVLSDNNCSGTTEWDESLAQYRPIDAVTVAPEGSDDSPSYLLIGATTVLVAGGCLYLLFRRGSLAHRAREDDEAASRE
jgi:hypothetical protein